MSTPPPGTRLRRRLLLGLPALAAAAAVAFVGKPSAAKSAAAPRVVECAADLIGES